ncbi:hypothetical protein BDW62DRAFT_192881 [Aspergillus aurantiobrunneus]
MEMRSLTRCLRSRPTATTSLLSTRQSALGQNQFLFARQNPQAVCFSSSSYNSNDNDSNSPRPRTQHLRPKSNANIDDILNQLNLSTSRQNRRSPQTKQKSPDGLSPTRAAREASFPDHPSLRQERRKVGIKLGSKLGRQITVAPERGRDLETALKRLAGVLTENNVKHQANEQKFHVRKGQLRKNLRIKRWRKLFKYSFTHTVNKIQRMRKQGW